MPLILLSGEYPGFLHSLRSYSPSFYIVVIWSGISGILLSVSSFWAVKTTSPTTYSMVGSLNKIPLTLIGVILFGAHVKLLGKISIAIGLFAGAMYSLTKKKAIVATPSPLILNKDSAA